MSKKSKWKKREGIVYSTDENFQFQDTVNPFGVLKTSVKQDLRVWFKKRNGKPVTVVTGYRGNPNTLNDLAKFLKTKCAVGGSVKDREIIIQGSLQHKVFELLTEKGYMVKKAGG